MGRHLSSRRRSSPSARLVPWLSPRCVSRFKVLLVQVREITHHLTVLSTTKGPSCTRCRNNTTRCSQVMSLDCLLFEGRVCFGRNLFPAGKVRFRTSHHVSRTTRQESTPRRAFSLTSRQVGGASFLIGPMISRESDRGVLRPCLFSRMPVLARSFTGFAFFYSRESRLVRGSKQGGGFRSTPVSAGIVFNPQSSARDLSAPYSDSCGSTLISPVSRVDAHNFLRVFARPRRERR